MKNLARLALRKYKLEERAILQDRVKQFIYSVVQPEALYFVGSILSGNFDDFSDIDVVVVFKTPAESENGRHLLYRAQQPSLGHTLDIICTDCDTFERKKKIGGIFQIAWDAR